MRYKVVIIHPAIAPYRIDFFNSLNEAFDVSFYFEHRAPLEQSFDQEELNKRIHFSYSFLASGLFGIKNLRVGILKILKREKPDMVFVSEYTILGLLVLLYKFFFNWKLKIVITCDDNLEMAESANFAKRCVRFLLLHYVDLVLLVNDQVKHWYEKSLLFKAQYFYFPIVQSDEQFRERLQAAMSLSSRLRVQYKLEGKKVLLYVGRLVRVKNVTLLLNAFKNIFEERKNLVLIIVGDGDERQSLQRLVKPLIEDGHIIFVGKKEGNELMAYYNLGDIFVLPSQYEPFGTVVNEALLSGCYVLCSSVAGASCLIQENTNGNVFVSNDLNDLVIKLRYSLSKSEKKGNKMLFTFDSFMKSFVKRLGAIEQKTNQSKIV
ncbi:glycosyltransferase family 4 protein [Parabacteroides johnsonii]|uniref:Glycosyl transferase family 1 domain-containing protein n=1 Tax=Parabacteroides johnsonii CL02T12C29 TaxID=999419 RepID=K5Z6E6_9BACT|nr:glycosyltransferase family 4 protein [Parabacteroides johnsonii]EKN11144.1 hypothetical protein HMPREF1077_01402 [Parabacteroides johnsonii CL02T12C29]